MNLLTRIKLIRQHLIFAQSTKRLCSTKLGTPVVCAGFIGRITAEVHTSQSAISKITGEPLHAKIRAITPDGKDMKGGFLNFQTPTFVSYLKLVQFEKHELHKLRRPYKNLLTKGAFLPPWQLRHFPQWVFKLIEWAI